MFDKFEAMKKDLVKYVDVFNRALMEAGIDGKSIELIGEPYKSDGLFCAKIKFSQEISLYFLLTVIYPKFEYQNVVIGPGYIKLMKKI